MRASATASMRKATRSKRRKAPPTTGPGRRALLPSRRARFEDHLPSWSGFGFSGVPTDGTVKVAWELESDDAPTAAHGVAYGFLKKHERAVTDAILAALAPRAPREDPTEDLSATLRRALGAPSLFLLERASAGCACVGFLIPCAWTVGRAIDVVVHRARVIEVAGVPVAGPAERPAPPDEPGPARGRGPRVAPSRRDLATVLARSGQLREAIQLLRAELDAHPDDIDVLDALIGAEMRTGALDLAAEHARRYAELRRGSRWYPERTREDPPLARRGSRMLTLPKLRHDVDQFRYLSEKGILSGELGPVIERYQRVIARLGA